MKYYDIFLEDKLNLKVQKIDEKDYDYIYVLTDIMNSTIFMIIFRTNTVLKIKFLLLFSETAVTVEKEQKNFS